MARDIGPDMLEILDEALANGSISKAQYDAKRIEVMELIRKGKAVELSLFDKVLQVALFVGGILLGLFVMQGGTLPAFLLGSVIIVAGIFAARRAGRIRL